MYIIAHQNIALLGRILSGLFGRVVQLHKSCVKTAQNFPINQCIRVSKVTKEHFQIYNSTCFLQTKAWIHSVWGSPNPSLNRRIHPKWLPIFFKPKKTLNLLRNDDEKVLLLYHFHEICPFTPKWKVRNWDIFSTRFIDSEIKCVNPPLSWNTYPKMDTHLSELLK